MKLSVVSYGIPMEVWKLLMVSLTVRRASCPVLALLPPERLSCVTGFLCRRDLMIVEQVVS